MKSNTVKKQIGRVAVCALLLGAGSVLAETNSPVMLDTFDVATAGTAVKELMVQIIATIGIVYGAAMGFVFLRWVYRKVVGAMGR